jgi:hypothetical protein
VRVTDDLALDGGEWNLTGEQKGWIVATITPPAVPMFQQVVEYLETKPVPRGGNFQRADEARAAVAVCLRWGSYFAVLADPSRPDAPDIADEQVSQIDDDEMARMNIEISAALEWWLTLRGEDEQRYWDVVHRALEYLPAGPKTVGSLEHGDMLLVCTMPDMAAQVRRSWPAERLDRDLEAAASHGIRVIANTITHVAWRNGPIEDVHAGRFHGYDFDRRRVPLKAEKAIIRQAQSGFSIGLKAVDFLKYDNSWPPPAERVLPFLHGLVGPFGWSHTELSCPVELPLRQDDQGVP